jgi:hypothetical protein
MAGTLSMVSAGADDGLRKLAALMPLTTDDEVEARCHGRTYSWRRASMGSRIDALTAG